MSQASYGHIFSKATNLAKYIIDDADESDVVSLALSLALPRQDVRALAEQLIKVFGNYAKVISAPVEDLLRVEGLGTQGALALKLIQLSSQRLLKPDDKTPMSIKNFDDLIPYLQTLLRYEKNENLRVIFLNKKNYILDHQLISEGSVGTVPVFIRKIVRLALNLNASGIILIHNHPSGDCTPSNQDVIETKNIRDALELFEITVHDHVVIGNGDWSSLKRLGFL